jgi:hypothetical protein
MIQPRSSFGAAVGGRAAWIAGGVFHSPVARVDRFQSPAWEEYSRMPGPRWGLAAAFLDTILVLAGGRTEMQRMQVTAEVDAFNPESGQWSELPPMGQPRMDFALVRLGEQLFAIGGQRAGNRREEVLNAVERLRRQEVSAPRDDPLAPQWRLMLVWPNPTNGLVNFRGPEAPGVVRLTDGAGRLIHQTIISRSAHTWIWDSAPYPAGGYIWTLIPMGGSAAQSGRIVVVK